MLSFWQRIKKKGGVLEDPSVLSLLTANFITIYFALSKGWSLIVVLWIYWFQSVIIGFFNFVRILSLKDFSTKNFLINNKSVKPTRWVKIFTAFFFAFHYGLFHLAYAIFLSVFSFVFSSELTVFAIHSIFLGAGIFFANHLFSFLYNKERDEKKQNIGRVMFYPYARIIPMHLIIIFGFIFLFIFGEKGVLLIFLLFKTLADVLMHIYEHKLPSIKYE